MKQISFTFFRLYILLLFFSLVSCEKTADSSGSKAALYYDIEKFFKNEANVLDSLNISINKVVESKGEIESKWISEVNFIKELDAFISAGINKPAWRDAFRVDTTVTDNATSKIKYTSINDDKVLIKEAELLFVNNSCIFVRIRKENKNLFYQFKQELEYRKAKGYFIKSEQNLKWIYSSEYAITTTFNQ